MSIKVYTGFKVKEGINPQLAIKDFAKKFEKGFIEYLWNHHNLRIDGSVDRLKEIQDYYVNETNSDSSISDHAELDILVYTLDNETAYLPILYGTTKKVYYAIKPSLLENFIDYSYWDNVEKPDHLPEKEWKERSKFYREIFYGDKSNPDGEEDYRISVFKAKHIQSKLWSHQCYLYRKQEGAKND